jgi:CheY-specific phosphatase CheX
MEASKALVSGKTEEITRFEEFLDKATNEVFSTMMGVGCTPVESDGSSAGETISAVIGLAGALSGSLVLHTVGAAAMRIAERMTGMECAEVDAMVRDAVGEVCNMVAGAWKGLDGLGVSAVDPDGGRRDQLRAVQPAGADPHRTQLSFRGTDAGDHHLLRAHTVNVF